MKTLLAFVIAVGFALCPSLAEDPHPGLDLSGVVKDQEGVPLGEILVWVKSGDQVLQRTFTNKDGEFSVAIEPDWPDVLIEVDAVQLLERGYFCLPGFEIDPDSNPDGILLVDLTAVPLTPRLTLALNEDRTPCVTLNFDWAENMSVFLLRQYRLERSSDCKDWKEVVTVALACPPIDVVDEAIEDSKVIYYRTVPVDDVFVSSLTPENSLFIADPSIGFGDGGMLLELESGNLPTTPVVAPRIIVQAADGE